MHYGISNSRGDFQQWVKGFPAMVSDLFGLSVIYMFSSFFFFFFKVMLNIYRYFSFDSKVKASFIVAYTVR